MDDSNGFEQVSRSEIDALLFPASTFEQVPDQLDFVTRVPVKYEFKKVTRVTEGKELEEVEPGEDLHGIEFRLFAPSKRSGRFSTSGTVRIKLDSPVDSCVTQSKQQRPRSYYFKDQPSPEQLQQLESAAVSGQQVIERSKRYKPFLTEAWNVEDQDALNKISPWLDKLVTVTDFSNKKRKKRPGKKSRVAIRSRERRKIELEAAAKQAAEDKALADRTKKAKNNRSKRLRHREREKAKKAAARCEAP